jgi:hypothetical protein
MGSGLLVPLANLNGQCQRSVMVRPSMVDVPSGVHGLTKVVKRLGFADPISSPMANG